MNNLKGMREKRGLTQAELAERSGVSIRTVQAYEQGLKDINKAAAITLYRMSQILRCAIEDLLEI